MDGMMTTWLFAAMMIVWAAVTVVLAIALVRRTRIRQPVQSKIERENAMNLLHRHYALNEISKEEYERRKKELT